jgi:alginate O-acetyltransferase complex protein AlgI
MVFSSHLFLYYFLPLALGLYYAAPGRYRNGVLTLLSYVFYGWADPRFVLLIVWTTVVDYCCGNLIGGEWRLFGEVTQAEDGRPRASSRQRKLFLGVSLVSNLGMLAFLKYFVFLQRNANVILEALGHPAFQVFAIALPTGISFYTFESISYNVDIYRGDARPALAWVKGARVVQGTAATFGRRLLDEFRALSAFACYITQFPHLVAGPIIRYQDLEAQIHRRSHTLEKFARGAFFLALGLGKKILIANPLGDVADMAFTTGVLDCVDAWYGIVSYAFQIYFDFSGYSDMAIGLGLMLGFQFVKNFDSPYKSESLTEFWRRWHISLSTWLRSYLYLPLGGNRRGPRRTYVNLMVVMLVGGLWHGASWNFVTWGGIHGAWLAWERAYGKRSFYAGLPAALRVAITFAIVNVAWVFFRAPTIGDALLYARALIPGASMVPPASVLSRAVLYSPYNVVIMLVAALVAFFGISTWDLARQITVPRAMAALALAVVSFVTMSAQSHNPFLYLQF